MLCLPCSDMDTMAVLMPAHRSAFSGTGASWIPPGSLQDPMAAPAAGPCSAQLLKPPQLKKAHQLSITSNRYCPILPPSFAISKHFAGFVIRQEQC